jgi:hypothetical protein
MAWRAGRASAAPVTVSGSVLFKAREMFGGWMLLVPRRHRGAYALRNKHTIESLGAKHGRCPVQREGGGGVLGKLLPETWLLAAAVLT